MFNLSLCILYHHPIGPITLRDRIRRLNQSGLVLQLGQRVNVSRLVPAFGR